MEVVKNTRNVVAQQIIVQENKMGFGWMFIGYFIAYLGSFLPEVSVFTYILGAGVILFSLKKLIFENKMFIVSSVVALLLEISCIAVAIMGFCGVDIKSTIYLIFGQAYQWGSYLLALCLMITIFVIAKEVDILKIKVMSIINTSVIGICAGFLLAHRLVFDEFARQRLSYVVMLLQVVFVLLGLFIIFNCYMKICYEDDEKMEKGTGNAVIDFLNKQLDDPFGRKGNKKNDKRKKK